MIKAAKAINADIYLACTYCLNPEKLLESREEKKFNRISDATFSIVKDANASSALPTQLLPLIASPSALSSIACWNLF
ncbi:MAG: hypothetical protein KAG53_09625 [Endozoicomonadaceae bacterium]|nr:hypothetical protein [Endozoicomonadaceae bacterium]